jgi:glycerol-3-phosphate dehydrogenase (NAD(P)+)
VPSQVLRSVLEDVAGQLGDTVPVVSLMKGVERSTGFRMSQVIREVTGIDESRIAVVSGPNLALEIAKEEPTASAVSSTSLETAVKIAATCHNDYFTTLTNTDVIGTEFGGVLKNLIAVAVGIADGVGYGDNTKASIITRGLAELSAFAAAQGAKPETMWGLAGLGDLIATCESPLSRNNTAGRLLGQGYSFEMVIRQMDQTAEGLSSVDPILTIAAASGVSMPIVSQVQQVLKGTLDPRELAPHLATNSAIPSEE